MSSGWYIICVFLALVQFSMSTKPKGVRNQLRRHGARLKAVEARQDVDKYKLADHAERISLLESLIESVLNDTKSNSLTNVENGKISSDITSVCSNICTEDDIRIILRAFHQEKVLNGHLREEVSYLNASVNDVNKDVKQAEDEISDLKSIISDVNEEVAQAVVDIHSIRNGTETVEEQCNQSDQEILAEVWAGIESFNSSIVYLTLELGEIDESTEMALNMCKKAFSEKQDINVKNNDTEANNGNQFITARPSSCKEIFDNSGRESGVYTVYQGEQVAPVGVYCDMETDGGGWTVFQRRRDGSEDFNRDWLSYELGFGNLRGEFWLGHRHISEMTHGCCYELRIDMDDFEGNQAYAKYGKFQVLSQAENYTLVVGNYSGTAGDSLTYHSGMAFSTKDRDNDNYYFNCANMVNSGGWWYNHCHLSMLNGIYVNRSRASYGEGIIWHHYKNTFRYSLKMTEMKYRKI